MKKSRKMVGKLPFVVCPCSLDVCLMFLAVRQRQRTMKLESLSDRTNMQDEKGNGGRSVGNSKERKTDEGVKESVNGERKQSE